MWPSDWRFGHQLDVMRGGVGVERAQRLGVERRRAGADLRMAPEAEGVLDVEHQHVQLQPHAEIDERAAASRASGTLPRDTSSMIPRFAKSGASSIEQAGSAPRASTSWSSVSTA